MIILTRHNGDRIIWLVKKVQTNSRVSGGIYSGLAVKLSSGSFWYIYVMENIGILASAFV